MVSPVPVFVVNELLKANRQIDINLSACSTKRFPLCKFHHAHHRKHCVFACTKHMNGTVCPVCWFTWIDVLGSDKWQHTLFCHVAHANITKHKWLIVTSVHRVKQRTPFSPLSLTLHVAVLCCLFNTDAALRLDLVFPLGAKSNLTGCSASDITASLLIKKTARSLSLTNFFHLSFVVSPFHTSSGCSRIPPLMRMSSSRHQTRWRVWKGFISPLLIWISWGDLWFPADWLWIVVCFCLLTDLPDKCD